MSRVYTYIHLSRNARQNTANTQQHTYLPASTRGTKGYRAVLDPLPKFPPHHLQPMHILSDHTIEEALKTRFPDMYVSLSNVHGTTQSSFTCSRSLHPTSCTPSPSPHHPAHHGILNERWGRVQSRKALVRCCTYTRKECDCLLY